MGFPIFPEKKNNHKKQVAYGSHNGGVSFLIGPFPHVTTSPNVTSGSEGPAISSISGLHVPPVFRPVLLPPTGLPTPNGAKLRTLAGKEEINKQNKTTDRF